MDSRGRYLVKMCQQDSYLSEVKNKKIEDQSSNASMKKVNNNETDHYSSSISNSDIVCNDNNSAIDVIIEKIPEALVSGKICKLASQDEFKILTCESAPASVITETIKDHFKPPQSAPMPINVSPLSLCSSNIDINDANNIISLYNNNMDISSPIRGSSPISGIDLLPQQTDEEPFSDSGSSWIPDTDEENKVRKRTASLKYLLTSASSDEYTNDSRKKRKVKKIKSKTPILSSESEAEITITKQKPPVIDVSSDQTLMTPVKEMQEKPAIIIAETTDSEVESTEEKKENKKCRWKVADPLNWKVNKELQKKRNSLPYKSKDGKIRAPKIPKSPRCSNNCRHKCKEIFTEEERVKICKTYWSIANFREQKEFLLKRIIIKPVQTTKRSVPIEKQRNSSREYGFFKNQTTYQRVCKNFFMATLCISSGPIGTAVKYIDENGSFSHMDLRGKGKPLNKTTDDQINDIKDHNQSFPTVDSHYCRKQSSRKYLDPTLSISKMYEFYVEKMKTYNKIPVKLPIYRKVFGTQYNLSFFHPKKDQCTMCNTYKKDRTNTSTQNKYSQHIERKEASYRAKEIDKKKSEEDDSLMCVTMDLQSFLQIPSTADSLMYYSRKLNLYNLSIYEFKPPQNNAYCMIWTEINGKRGSIEIASAIYLWIMKLPEAITHVIIYSDTCSGQNRNQYIAAFLLHLVHNHRVIQIIEQKYLESGHSFMEVDSMHSAIEKEKRHREVYSLIDWKDIMQKARSKRHNKNATPYKVTELSYKDMLDVKSLALNMIRNKNVAENGETVSWLKIKCLRFEKDLPGFIKYRYDYDGVYNLLNTLCKPGRSTRRTLNTEMPFMCSQNIPRAYNHLLPITKEKKRDLLQLCKKKIIPEELHGWYENLPSSNNNPSRQTCTDSSDTDN